MMYWVIVEYHNGLLNSIRGPYTTEEEGYSHRDKCIAYRLANPVPLKIEFKLELAYPPQYVG